MLSTVQLKRVLGKLCVVGATIFLVLIGAGSHYRESTSGAPQIYPHKPVHLAQSFNFFTNSRYVDLLQEAVGEWNEVVGGEVLFYSGALGTQQVDAIFIDLPEGGNQQITYTNHNGDIPTFSFSFVCECPSYARVETVPPHLTLGEPLKVGVFNENPQPDGLFGASDDRHVRRWFIHELGHVLSLKDHDNEQNPGAYTGMMDGTCSLNNCDAEGDYQILNFTLAKYPNYPLLQLFPDEASCVRKLFNIPGKQLCDEN